ncbi:MAG TPA: DUF4394 domain-containing protein [Nocardioidaceae bacterium]|nr:DUF4394 domain-containing protein [Nocardioidaceae bacterium]
MRTSTTLALAGVLAASSLTLVSTGAPAQAAPAETAYALGGSGTTLLSFPVSNPGYVASRTISGVAAGETLVDIDVRPQNGRLYTLGVNATANTATLYAVTPQTGGVAAVGAPGSIAFVNDVGAPIDFLDPNVVGWDIDFNPTVDRVRVVAGGGLSFRVLPNVGLPFDFNGGVAGVQPDSNINGATSSVDAAAYINNVANATTTTLFDLDSGSNGLYLQVPPNNGVTVLVAGVTLGGAPLDFTGVSGFDVAPGVEGLGHAALQVDGKSGLYRISLTDGVATFLGHIGTGAAVSGFAVQRDLDDGRPVVSLTADGTALVRFNTNTPGTTTTVGVSGVTAGETLVAISWRPSTGQLVGFGVNAVAETGTFYIVDPQSGAVTAVGTPSQVSWSNNLPDPTAAGYGMDISPTADRVRIVAADGLNARINPNNGLPVDGDPLTVGTQPDTLLTSGGVVSAAYANSYAGATSTTLFDLNASTDQLLVQEPPNNGTLGQAKAITLNGAALDFSARSAFDLTSDVRVASNGAGSTGTAVAVLTVDGTTGLYDISLATGAATLRGTMLASLRSIAVGEAERDRAKIPATLSQVAKPKQVKAKVNTGRVLTCPAGFSTPKCSATLKVKAGTKVLGKKTVAVNRGAKLRLVVPLSAKGKAFLVRRGTVKSVVTVTCPCGAAAAAKTYRLRLTLSAAKL